MKRNPLARNVFAFDAQEFGDPPALLIDVRGAAIGIPNGRAVFRYVANRMLESIDHRLRRQSAMRAPIIYPQMTLIRHLQCEIYLTRLERGSAFVRPCNSEAAICDRRLGGT